MKRWMTIPVLTWLLAPLAFSQSSPSPQPCPDPAAESGGCELIAWSRLQEPVPLPNANSFPYPDRQATQSDKRPSGPKAGSLVLQPHAAETIEGMVARAGDGYWLKVSGELSLLLDDKQIAQGYEGRRVRVKGTVDAEGKMLKVEIMAPLS